MTQAVQSMRQCVIDRVETLRVHLPAHIALEEWLSGGGITLDEEYKAAVEADPNAIEHIAAAWGYLEGVADTMHMTVLEMLAAADVSLDVTCACANHVLDHRAPALPAFAPSKRPRNPCPKCGSASHRCRTGECRHCDNEACGYVWFKATKTKTRRAG